MKQSAAPANHYVANAVLLDEFLACKKSGVLSKRMIGYLQQIAEKYSRHPSWSGYSYRDDLVAEAVANLIERWDKFDPSKSNQIFSYYTTACYRSFLYVLHHEHGQANIKNAMLMDAGFEPSFNHQENFRNTEAMKGHDD